MPLVWPDGGASRTGNSRRYMQALQTGKARESLDGLP